MEVKTKTTHVIRGGSWNYASGYLRSAFRYELKPDLCYSDLSFRLIKLDKGKKYESKS